MQYADSEMHDISQRPNFVLDASQVIWNYKSERHVVVQGVEAN